MSRPWMPFYVRDYLGDTGHLTLAQHGAYLLLIMHYWTHGKLPDNEGEIARILRVSNKQLPSIWLAIAPFFNADRSHKRIDEELAKHDEIRTKRQIAGMKGGLSKRGTINRSRILGQANAKQTDNQSQSHIETTALEIVDEAPPKEDLRGRFQSKTLEQIVKEKGWV